MENSLVELTNDEKIARMKKAFDAYNVKHDFKVGDIVIGKKDCPVPIKCNDEPLIVVEVGCTIMAPGKYGQNCEGAPRTLRVARQEKFFNTFLVDPNYFEPYAG